MLLKQLINKGIETISPLYPEGEAKEMVFALLEYMLGTKRYTHIIEPSLDISEDKVQSVETAFARLAAGEPVQYITGHADFYGRRFHVTPSVLIPRPETEILCRTALEHLSSAQSVLDLCTGSGCIAWTMAMECPGAEVTAVDISDDALEVARNQTFAEDMARAGAVAPFFVKADVLAGPESFLTSDVLTGHDSSAVFDLILSNPPYVMDKEKVLMRPNVLEHEPHLALFVSDDDPLIFYRAIARWSATLLARHGTGIVEINEALGMETALVFKDAGFTHTEILKDLNDRDRFVLFRR